jgi:isopentenyl diphosphate isomerase/L-lactate dehydrogenase-like FMN-dependent dehydrogenase
MSSKTLEEISQINSGVNFFQLYMQNDQCKTIELVKRAEINGYKAIILTVDVPIMGKRERDIKNKFKLPDSILAANLSNTSNNELQKQTNASSVIKFTDSAFKSPNWDDVNWLKSNTKLPIILKGILSPYDAGIAIDTGVDGIVVSNHGGRQLDGVPSSLEVLNSISKKIKNKIPIFFDGGIRRGTDILKALYLGADYILIGRPLIWGLALGGYDGVLNVLETLISELTDAMILTGVKNINEIKNSTPPILSY